MPWRVSRARWQRGWSLWGTYLGGTKVQQVLQGLSQGAQLLFQAAVCVPNALPLLGSQKRGRHRISTSTHQIFPDSHFFFPVDKEEEKQGPWGVYGLQLPRASSLRLLDSQSLYGTCHSNDPLVLTTNRFPWILCLLLDYTRVVNSTDPVSSCKSQDNKPQVPLGSLTIIAIIITAANSDEALNHMPATILNSRLIHAG